MVKKRGNAFTLLEMIVVLGIIILVTSVMIPMIGSFLGGSGVQSGHRIIQGVLMKARSMAVNTRRPYAVIFDIDPAFCAFLPQGATPIDHRNPPTAADVTNLESIYTGRIQIWDIQRPIDPMMPAMTMCVKEGGEVTLPRNVTFSYSPGWCRFNADGSMVMGSFTDATWNAWYNDAVLDGTPTISSANANTWLNPMMYGFPDATTTQFEQNVNTPINMGQFVNSGMVIPYDMKIVRKGGSGKVCFVNLVSLTGRPGKWKVGPRTEQ